MLAIAGRRGWSGPGWALLLAAFFLRHANAQLRMDANDPASECRGGSIATLVVEPQPPQSSDAPERSLPPCDSRVDVLKCQIEAAYHQFARFSAALSLPGQGPSSSLPILGLRQVDSVSTSITRYVDHLLQSPAIQETLELRKRARVIAKQSRWCEPNYIYLGERPLFGVGPAFISSNHFQVESQSNNLAKPSTNFISLEDARAPFHLPVRLITKDSLLTNHYYDIVVAHEMAHGLMQDLYGVEAFAVLESQSVTRDGHFASAITDPTIAWIEGFAEGFEAYLGEKYSDAQTPHLSRAAIVLQNRVLDFQNYGWRGYLWTLPDTVAFTLHNIARLDDIVSDFLKAERQDAIRENHFVLKGEVANLAHQFGFVPTGAHPLEVSALANWEIEDEAPLWNKEGVVAHIVYQLLRAGMAARVFETIAHFRPANFWEFLTQLRLQMSVEEWAAIEPVLRETFTVEGREHVQQVLWHKYDQRSSGPPYDRLSLNVVTPTTPGPADRGALGDLRPHETLDILDDLGTTRELGKSADSLSMQPFSLPSAPPEWWVEFWNPSLWRQKTVGSLDRINLATARPGRISDFLRAIGLPTDRINLFTIAILQSRARMANERDAFETLDDLLIDVLEHNPSFASTRLAILKQQLCFWNRCVAKSHL